MSKAPANNNAPPSSHDQNNSNNMLGHGFSKKMKLDPNPLLTDWSDNNFKTLPLGQDNSQMFQNYNYDSNQNNQQNQPQQNQQQQQPPVSMPDASTTNQSAIPSTSVSVTAANTVENIKKIFQNSKIFTF